MVNDYKDPQAVVDFDLLECKNYFVLLVSATPYNMLSQTSRIPEKYVITGTPPGRADQDKFQLLKPHMVLQLSTCG